MRQKDQDHCQTSGKHYLPGEEILSHCTDSQDPDHKKRSNKRLAEQAIDNDPGQTRDPSRDRGNKSRKAEITGHPFTASETVKQGPLVSEHQKKTQERHKGSRQKPDPDLGDGPGPGNVKHQDYSAPNPAQLSGDVYGACIATVLVSWISPSQNPKQNDREVD